MASSSVSPDQLVAFVTTKEFRVGRDEDIHQPRIVVSTRKRRQTTEQQGDSSTPRSEARVQRCVLHHNTSQSEAKFGGLDVSDVSRLEALEDEIAKLKKLLAETMPDITILYDINSQKW